MSKITPILVWRREAYDLRCDDASLTKQEFKEDTDINVLIERFTATGRVTPSAVQPVYMDATIYPDDFLDAMNIVAETNEAFADLPADLRALLGNDPRNYLSALQTQEGRDLIASKGVELPEGLSATPLAPAPVPTPPASPNAPDASSAPPDGGAVREER